jgi:hypothetical protein
VDTVRVDICYRPLRIGWAIRADDVEAFRCAVRLSFALWGGRFNPIIVVDQEELAQNLVEVFRVDVILPIGASDAVQSFARRFPYLIKPFICDQVFIDDGEGGARSQVLDIHNALVHLHETPEWKGLKEQGVRLYSWAPDDPLADVFLTQLGQYPASTEVPISTNAQSWNSRTSSSMQVRRRNWPWQQQRCTSNSRPGHDGRRECQCSHHGHRGGPLSCALSTPASAQLL